MTYKKLQRRISPISRGSLENLQYMLILYICTRIPCRIPVKTELQMELYASLSGTYRIVSWPEVIEFFRDTGRKPLPFSNPIIDVDMAGCMRASQSTEIQHRPEQKCRTHCRGQNCPCPRGDNFVFHRRKYTDLVSNNWLPKDKTVFHGTKFFFSVSLGQFCPGLHSWHKR